MRELELAEERRRASEERQQEPNAGIANTIVGPTSPVPDPTRPSGETARAEITVFRNTIVGDSETRVAIGCWRGYWRTLDEFAVSSIAIEGRLTRQAVLDIASRIGTEAKLKAKLAAVAGIDTFDFVLNCKYSIDNPPTIASPVSQAVELDWSPELVPRVPVLDGSVEVSQKNKSVEVRIAAAAGGL
ncbi:MAG TPA: hypothetical protein VGQ65_20620 [Thermoanaerobaculia bacterium]|jgi:hypothetical protein|nr:hypothetical protein [Thermoanaerobaculia bacterium]